ncbi:MAG: DmsC/YnfH family molybdoenzyme membrane anchor subunit [Candidatus Methylacidiphilales bacterium]
MAGQLQAPRRAPVVRHVLSKRRTPEPEHVLTAGTTLLDTLLKEQQTLTAVERFSQKHSNAELPAQQQYYQDLIPLTKPAAGEQYAFSVDLDACTGCKGCVSACHNLNGLDDGEIWRNVGLIESAPPKVEIVARLDEMVTGAGTCHVPSLSQNISYQQTVTTACHHCVEPGCLEGCPVLAYEKDAATGLVRHLDDQCIGCQYCVLKCPYDVPKYHAKKGIVRKCDMCHSRLSAGEAPACVQACPNEAIRITLVRKADVKAVTKPGDSLLPGAFDSTYTYPTTRYTSKRGPVPANARPADADALRLEHTHWPLVGMLIFTQAGAGLFLFDAMVRGAALMGADTAQPGPWLTLGAFMLLQIGLGVSVFHLGKPLKAWRAFLGWRTSWMSREILAFGPFAGLGAAATGLAMLHFHRELLSVFGLQKLTAGTPEFSAALAKADVLPWVLLKVQWLLQLGLSLAPEWAVNILYSPALLTILSATTAMFGLAGVACSTMIYVDTHRPFWRASLSFPKFFGTLLWIGAAASASLCAGSIAFGSQSHTLESGLLFSIAVTLLIATLKMRSEVKWLQALTSRKQNDAPVDKRSMQLHTVLQAEVVRTRFWLGAVGGIAMPILGLAAWATGLHAVVFTLLAIGFLLSLLSEVTERMLFFRCVQAPKMPGTLAPAPALAPAVHGH